MRKFIDHDDSARAVATAIVLDDCREDLERLGFGAEARAFLYELVEDVITATRAGEAFHVESAIEKANDDADEAYEERVVEAKRQLGKLAKCSSLDDVRRRLEKVVEKLG